jgi:hypothetical protein
MIHAKRAFCPSSQPFSFMISIINLNFHNFNKNLFKIIPQQIIFHLIENDTKNSVPSV